MKMPPPATARFSTPMTPLAPAVCVVVVISIDCDIQDISPASETIVSPGFSVTSRTGSTVPWICASIARPPVFLGLSSRSCLLLPALFLGSLLWPVSLGPEAQLEGYRQRRPGPVGCPPDACLPLGSLRHARPRRLALMAR